jgi:hypothetical protein
MDDGTDFDREGGPTDREPDADTPKATLMDPSILTSMRIENTDDLSELLWEMNDKGDTPTLVGVDRSGTRFLAYGWAPGGDGWDTGVVTDDTHSGEWDYSDVDRCGDCGAFGRRSTLVLIFPVLVI